MYGGVEKVRRRSRWKFLNKNKMKESKATEIPIVVFVDYVFGSFFDGKSGIKFHKNNILQQEKSGGVSFGTNIWNRHYSGGMRTDPAHWNFEEKCRDFAEFCGTDGGVSDLYVLLKFLLYIQGI